MTTPQTPRWYSVNNMGMATLCADQADAENVASDCDTEWPRQAPHRAVQLVEASTLDTERTARIAAQVENEALKAERTRSGLAHRKAVQEAVRESADAAKLATATACADVCAEMAQQLRGHGDVAGAEIAEALRDAIRARGAT